MAELNEILVDWTHPSGTPGVSVLHFDAGVGTITQQRAGIAAMIFFNVSSLANGVSARVRTTGRVIESTTGELVGEWNETTNLVSLGTAAGSAIANASQALLRLKTGVVVRGRFLQGRVFIPGISITVMNQGQLTTSAMNLFNSSLATWVASAAPPVVWSRPKLDTSVEPPAFTPGQAHPVNAATVWPELAVLRRRR